MNEFEEWEYLGMNVIYSMWGLDEKSHFIKGFKKTHSRAHTHTFDMCVIITAANKYSRNEHE